MLDFTLTIHIALIMLCGAVTTKSDIISGKIKNKNLGLFLIFGGISNAILLFVGHNNELIGFKTDDYINVFFLNQAIVVLVAYLVWQFGLWTAGDAKLFMVFSFILPLNFYSNGFIGFFPGLAFLINCFMPLFFLILILSIVHLAQWLSRPEKNHLFYIIFLKNELSNYFTFFEFRKLITTLLFLFFISGIFTLISGGKIFLFIGLFIVQRIMRDMLKDKRMFYVLLLLAAIMMVVKRIFFGVDLYEEASRFIHTVYYMVIFLIINRVVDFYIEMNETKKIKHNEIKQKMVLSDHFLLKIKNAANEVFSEIKAEGITSMQALYLKKWGKENKKDITIYKTIPFAPWIFLGVILTLLLKQSVLHALMDYI